MCSWEVSLPEPLLSSLTLSFTSHQLSKQPLTSYKLSKRIIPLKMLLFILNGVVLVQDSSNHWCLYTDESYLLYHVHNG